MIGRTFSHFLRRKKIPCDGCVSEREKLSFPRHKSLAGVGHDGDRLQLIAVLRSPDRVGVGLILVGMTVWSGHTPDKCCVRAHEFLGVRKSVQRQIFALIETSVCAASVRESKDFRRGCALQPERWMMALASIA